jgi:ABC-type Fe3+ transport system permease subunit
MFNNIATALPFVKSGRLRALAVTGATRSPSIPEVATMSEAGYPSVDVSLWEALFAPAATPSDLISSAILHQIDPSLEEASINLGVSPLMTFARLTVPLMLGGIVGGMVLTWVSAASELSSTVVLYSGEWQTLTVVMFQALEGQGAGRATATASLLIFFTVVPVAVVYRLLRRYEMSLL